VQIKELTTKSERCHNMPNIDFTAVTAYYTGQKTPDAIRAGIYIQRLPEAQQQALSALFITS
jgi:hypothetical protein